MVKEVIKISCLFNSQFSTVTASHSPTISVTELPLISRREFCRPETANALLTPICLPNSVNTLMNIKLSWLLFTSFIPSVLWCCWLGGRKSTRPVKTELWGASVVICLERGADLHMAQLMPLPLTVSCFSKIQTGFTFLVPAHPGSPGQRAVKQVCVCVCELYLRKALRTL